MADTDSGTVEGGAVGEAGDAPTNVDNAQAEEELMAVDNNDSEATKGNAEAAGGEEEEAAGGDDNTEEIGADELDQAIDNMFGGDGLEEDPGEDEDDKDHHEEDRDHEDLINLKDETMEEDEEEEEEEEDEHNNQDPNVLPQVNVAVLAQRKWQVKVYPLKPSDFTNGQISRVFKHARESLLYLQSPGRNARGKGEMYVSSANQAVRCVHSLMRLDFSYPEINVEIVRKNDEGVIEEKAYLRFDSKLTQILTLRPFRSRGGPQGRKRDRMIGSVFLKNLPPGTSKDTLRVMFPFAQEINYNPEKFKECTARLVLPYRSHVIPCLKAFAKVELGEHVLELYPLTKRKRTRTDEEDVSEAKQRKKVEEARDDSSVSKAGTDNKGDAKRPPAKKPAVNNKDATAPKRFSIKTGSTGDKKPEGDKRVAPKTSTQTRADQIRKASKFFQMRQQVQKSDIIRPTLVATKERSSSFTAPARSESSSSNRRRTGHNANRPRKPRKPRQDRSPASSTRSFHSERAGRSRDFRSPPSRVGGDRNPRMGGGGSVSGDRMGRQSGSRGNAGYRAGAAGNFGGSGGAVGGFGGLSASDASLAVSAEATKEMMLLQNQLGMAIKNQLAMLNQTTMAVEQAKRGLGTAADLQASSSMMNARQLSPRGLGARGAAPARRSVDQYRPGSTLHEEEFYHDEFGGARPKIAPSRQRRRRSRGFGAVGSGRGSNTGAGVSDGGGGGGYGVRGGNLTPMSPGGFGSRGANAAPSLSAGGFGSRGANAAPSLSLGSFGSRGAKASSGGSGGYSNMGGGAASFGSKGGRGGGGGGGGLASFGNKRGRGGGGGGSASFGSKRGGGGSTSFGAKRGGGVGSGGLGGRGKGAAGGGGGYGNRGAAARGYRDVNDWDDSQSNLFHDPYSSSKDYGYEKHGANRNLSSYGSSSRLGYDYSQDIGYSNSNYY